MEFSQPISHVKVERPAPEGAVFSIVIPTWNNLEHLKLLLRSIAENSVYQHQVVIFVNEGKDGTAEYLQEHTQCSFIHSPTNVGICVAMNWARSLVKTPYILYVNDDMYLCPKWDEPHMKTIQEIGHDWFYLSSTLVEPVDTGNACVVVADYGKTYAEFHEQDLKNDLPKLHKSDWQGSTWPPSLMAVTLWDIIGGFSIEYSPGMYSDNDIARKLYAAGVRYFRGLGDSKCYHFVSVSTKRIKHNAGSKTFLQKWGLTARLFTDVLLKRGQNWSGTFDIRPLTSSEKALQWFKKLTR